MVVQDTFPVVIADGDQTNEGYFNGLANELMSISGLNLIRMLIDRDIDFSAGNFDWWGDAYVDSNGRENSVSSATANYSTGEDSYTATFETTGSAEAADWSDTPNDAQNSLNITVTVTATCIPTTVSCSNHSGSTDDFTFTIKKNGNTIATKSDTGVAPGAVATVTFAASDYDDVWETDSTNQVAISGDIDTKNDAAGYSGTLYSIAAQELWINESGNEIEVTEVQNTTDEVTITHDIPSGTFSSTISKSIGVPFVNHWETGADIKYKITNTGGDDSGYLDCGITPEISSFTAFTAEPDTLIVKLIPKSSSPGTVFPSIKGFVVRAT